ncbi:MAG: FtsX-like permease family protein [Candidatus Limnocylindrales bacterium]
MLAWLRLWQPVAGRARSDWPFLFAVWLLVVSATTLLAAGALYAETVEVGGLRRALAEAAPPDRGVMVRTSGTATEAAALDGPVSAALVAAFDGAGATVVLTARSTALVPVGSSTVPAARRLVVLGSYASLDQHAELVTGHWPEAGHQPFQAVLSQAAADALNLAVGGHLALADASVASADPNLAVANVEIVGIWRPNATDPYWLGDQLDLAGTEDNGNTLFRGPVMVAAADLLAGTRSGQLQLGWRALPNVERMRVDQLAVIRAGVAGLPSGIAQVLPPGRFVTVSTTIGNVLGSIDRSALVSRSGVVLMTLQFGILAGYALLLAGGLLVERRRPEVGLLRARGASTAQVAALALGEAALLAVPAVLVAPWIALTLVDALGHWGAVGSSGIIAAVAISSSTVLAAALAGALCVLALTLPALISDLDLARVRAAIGRPLARTAAQRLGLDLVLVILAAVGLYQLRTYGAPLTTTAGGSLGVDPLLVAAPAIGMAAGGVLVVRLVPRLGEILEWLLRRRRGLVLALGARQLARKPLRYTRSALLIVLAGALGTFAAAYTATWSQSQDDQARYQAGADLRIALPVDAKSGPAAEATSLRAVPGITAVARLEHDQVDVGRALRGADLVGLEPETMVSMVKLAPDAAGTDPGAMFATLAKGRPKEPGIDLPGTALRLGVIIDASLQALPDFGPPLQDPWPGLTITPTVQYADGSTASLKPVVAAFVGANQRVTFALDAPPARLLSVDVDINSPQVVAGDIAVRAIETSPTADANDWSMVADAAMLSDWSFSAPRSSFGRGSLSGPTIHYADDAPLFPFSEDVPSYTWSPEGLALAPLPAIVNDRFLAAAGVKVGDTFEMDLHFRKVPALIVGSIAVFPSLDATKPFLLVDAATLDAVRRTLGQATVPPNEWWLSVDDDALAAVSSTLAAPPFEARQIASRAAISRSLASDPVALGLVGALALGSLAAAVFATVGFLVTAVVSAREQLGEFALLRALGLSSRQVLAWFALDHFYLLAVGLLAGVGLGWLIAQLVLPFAILDRSGLPVVPSPVIVVPWELLASVGVVALLLLVVTVLASGRQVGARPIVDVLRAQEG